MIRHSTIRLDESFFTPEGYFLDDVIVTTLGVFDYTESDGTVRKEARLPEHVFCEKSLESYKGKPIIITHSTKNDGLVDSTDYKDYEVGTILKAYQDGDNVRCEIVIKDVEAVKAQDNRELSLAYTPNNIIKSGHYGEEPFDEIQTDIRINNLAIVGQARAGSNARLNLDEEETKMDKDKIITDKEEVVKDEDYSLKKEIEDKIEDAVEDVLDEVFDDKPSLDADYDKEKKYDAEYDKEGSYKEGYDAGYKAAVAYYAKALEETAKDYVEKDEPILDAEVIIEPDEDTTVKLDSVEELLDVRETAARIGMDVKGMSMPAAKTKIVSKLMPSIRLDGKDINTLYTLAAEKLASRKPVSSQYQGMVRTDSVKHGKSSYEKAHDDYTSDFYSNGGEK